jgi:hypothetical protein
MNIESFIAAKAASRAANGLHVRITFKDGVREPFNYYAKDTASRDEYVARARAAIGKSDRTGLGHVIETVEIVSNA